MFKWILYTKHFLDFHNVHHLSRKRIEEWQKSRLTRVVSYLANNTTFYKDVLRRSGSEPDMVKGMSDITRLPILRKFDFIGRNVDEYTDVHHPIKGSWTTTSGSTGVPFTPLRRSISNVRFYADSIRYRFLIDKQWWNLTIDWARVVHIRVFPVYRENHLVVPIKKLLNNPEEAIKDIVGHSPDIIESYPSAVLEFIKLLASHNIRFSVPYVITGGEALTPVLRNKIEKSLECELFHRYALEEFGVVASECHVHDGYHVNVESFIVEILDEKGGVVPEGQSGRIVISDLYSYQMPFIRYDTGDHGHVSWHACGCGLRAMRVWVQGRRLAIFTLSLGNRRFHHFDLSEALKTFMGHIMQFQFEKSSEQSIVVRIVPGASFEDVTEKSIRDALEDVLGSDISISIEKVTSISKLPSGKIPVFLDATKR